MAPRPSDAILVRSVAEGLSPLASLLLEGARAAAGLTWDGRLFDGMHTPRDRIKLAEAYARIPGAPELTVARRRALRNAAEDLAAAGLVKLDKEGHAFVLTVDAKRLANRRLIPQRLAFAKLDPNLTARTGKGWALDLLIFGADAYRAARKRCRWSLIDLANRLGVSKRAIVKARRRHLPFPPEQDVPFPAHGTFRSPPNPDLGTFRSPHVGTTKEKPAHVDRDDLEAPEQHRPPAAEAELRSDAPRANRFEIVRDQEPEAVAEPVTPPKVEPDREAFEGEAGATVSRTSHPPELLSLWGRLEREATKHTSHKVAIERLRGMALQLDQIEREHGAVEAWFVALTACGVCARSWFRTQRREIAENAAAQLGPPLGCLAMLEILKDRPYYEDQNGKRVLVGPYGDQIRNIAPVLAAALNKRPEQFHAEAKRKGHEFLDEASGIQLEPTEAEAATIARTSATTATVAAAFAVDHRTTLQRLDDALQVLWSGSPVDGLDLLADLEELTRVAEGSGREGKLRHAIATTFRAAARALEKQTADRPAVALRLVKLGRERIAEFVGPAAADHLLNLAA